MPAKDPNWSFKQESLMSRSILIFLFWFIASCSSSPISWTQTYDGASLPDKQEVKLHHNFDNYREVIVIDGIVYTKTHEDPKLFYTLIPGKHRIEYYLKKYKRGWAIGGFIVNMKAGHTYILEHKVVASFFGPKKSIVILMDDTEGAIVETKYFPEQMPWDENIEELQIKYRDDVS
jgi:hypothetical protein